MNRPFEHNHSLDRTRFISAYNEGLRVYMQKVFSLMALALAFSGLLAFTVGTNQEIFLALYHSPIRFFIMFAPLGIVFAMSYGAHSFSLKTFQLLYWVYAGAMGLSLGWIFAVYPTVSIARVFFITSSLFGGMALYGYTTKKDLTSWGSFLFMGLLGIVIASLVNLFFHSTAMQFMVSVAGVIVFTGLTAYDTQKIKDIYADSDDFETAGKKAYFGALTLYLDFINLFLHLLRLLEKNNKE